MLILVLLSLDLNISPNPIEGRIGDKIPFSVAIMNEEGMLVSGKKEFDVIPSDLGRIMGTTFIPNRMGRGVLKCKATVKGETITDYAYIRITEEKKVKIIPSSAFVEPGEEIQFKIPDGKYLNWKVIPEELGFIRDGLFIAKTPGRGRIVLMLDDGSILSAFVRVKGKLNPLEIVPKFKKTKSGEKIQFSLKERGEAVWEVRPEDIGTIDNNGIFYAKSPGRGVVVAKIKEGNTERLGRAIVIVSGKLKIRIIPERITLDPGESAHFQLKSDTGIYTRNIPVRWKVIPKECGIIRKDGTFTAGKFPLNGRVVAIIPQRFGGGVVSSRISIVPKYSRFLTVIPRFKKLEVGEEYSFRTLQNVPVTWKIIPENLGTITQDGKFAPKRSGSGVIVVEPKDYINMRPGRALLIIGNNPIVDLYLPSEIFERFSIPIRIITNLEDYKAFYRIIPEHAGKITPDGIFYANPLPEGKQSELATIYAVLYRNRDILGWGKVNIRIIKRGLSKE